MTQLKKKNTYKVKCYKQNTNKKPVVRSDGKEFTSVKQAASEIVAMGLCESVESARASIKDCCKGKNRTSAYGYSWEYVQN